MADSGSALVACRRQEREEPVLDDGDGVPKDQELDLKRKKNFFFWIGQSKCAVCHEGRKTKFYLDVNCVVLASVGFGVEDL